MPYEQAVNGNLVDGRSDLFALGATLYHLLTGQVPFPGQTHEEIVREKSRGAFRPVRVLRPDVPVDLDRILSRTLSRDPRSRYQSAAEFMSALTATGLDRGPMALPGVPNESPPRVSHLPAARTHMDLVATPGNRPGSGDTPGGPARTRWILVLSSLMAAIVGFGGTWAVFHHRFAPTGKRDPVPDQLSPGASSSAGTTGGDYNKPSGPAAGG
jgi:serine/threonine protein kinase